MEQALNRVKTSMIYLLAADAILVMHLLFVAFIVVGLLLIHLGKTRRWFWIRNPWFRLAHVAAIGVVTLQSWFGVLCPLTILEKALRLHACEAVYTGSFISHLLETILYILQSACVGICSLLYYVRGDSCCELDLGPPTSIY
jgi:hypothetical protein